MLLTILAIATGACAGALLRFAISQALNPLLAAFPLGTLAVNLLGCLLMGLAMGFFNSFPALPPQLKLLFITGFLGSLTTFSAFAGEIAVLLEAHRHLLAAGVICLHVGGSIIMVFLGLLLFHLIKS